MSYACGDCGFTTTRWMGFCPQCRGSDALQAVTAPARAMTRLPTAPVPLPEVPVGGEPRLRTGVAEVDRVLGGGLVPGSTLLLGGEPGVGKSTLLLQLAAAVAGRGGSVLYATAEESAAQVAGRARRLGASHGGVSLLAERDVDLVVGAAAGERPDVLVVDSIQTVGSDGVGAAGGVAQVRECTARLVRLAKEQGVVVVLVGHVTKDGAVAGPKQVEHVVDAVLYLEGETDRGLRVLRSLKNRFGPTHQAGLFEMRDAGLVPVEDPSRALVGGWTGHAPGAVVFPTVEGRRPVLVEVQALVADAGPLPPRRSVRGLDAPRVHQVLAVLHRHAGLSFASSHVYVAVAGGVRVREPAGDLAVALALASSLLDRPLGPVAAWGEVGLTGEVRPASHDARRREEASRLGISRVVAPAADRRGSRLVDALTEVAMVA